MILSLQKMFLLIPFFLFTSVVLIYRNSFFTLCFCFSPMMMMTLITLPHPPLPTLEDFLSFFFFTFTLCVYVSLSFFFTVNLAIHIIHFFCFCFLFSEVFLPLSVFLYATLRSMCISSTDNKILSRTTYFGLCVVDV